MSGKDTRAAVTDAVLAAAREFSIYPWLINRGHCGEFAQCLSALLDDQGIDHLVLHDDHVMADSAMAECGVSHNGHVVVYVPEIAAYFDAEAPQGVGHILQLPIFAEQVVGDAIRRGLISPALLTAALDHQRRAAK